MPELPEVETIRRQLEKEVVGRRIIGAYVRYGGRLNVRPTEFTMRVSGATFTAARRRAKLLLLELSNGYTLVTHLKMTGKYLLMPAGAAPGKHVHLVFKLSGGHDLFFEDVRKFGYVRLYKSEDIPKLLDETEAYGPEPLDHDFTAAKFAMCVRGRPAKKIKPLLMDQSCIAGIGNIYADESLWRAGIRPQRRVSTLTNNELDRLHQGIIASLSEAIAKRGSSADNYVDLHGKRGENVPNLAVYGRGGEPCRRCGTPIKKVVFAGRGTHYCPKCQKGFTLIELLFTVSIIGVLSAASVVSYSSVRTRVRDTKRITDAKQIQVALALFLDANGAYPGDGKPGAAGVPVGEEGYTVLSDAGFGTKPKGAIYILPAPKNPTPLGTHYVYRSLDENGNDCNLETCPTFALLFTLEHPQDDLSAGSHVMLRGGGIAEPRGFLPDDLVPLGAANADEQEDFDRYMADAAQKVRDTVNDPNVQKANERVVAPTVAVATAFNTAFGASQFGQYLLLFLSQPAALLGLRRRKAWGTVYTVSTHMPVDLAIVRLRQYESNRVLQSTVTDAEGRFAFLVPKGNYRIEVAKAGLLFPSALPREIVDDGPYHELYRGDVLPVGDGGGVLTPNIPTDAVGGEKPDADIIKADGRRRWHNQVALASPVLGAIVFALRPTLFVGLLFAAEVTLYLLFKRLARPQEPKNWGTVYDKKTRKPVYQAVVRIFSAKYNKLLEAQVTDQSGRYHFRVMSDTFYLTVTKNGYRKTETEPFDLTQSTTPVVVASDLPLASTKDIPLSASLPTVPVPALPAALQHEPPAVPVKKSVLVPPPPKPTYAPKISNDAPQLPDAWMEHAAAHRDMPPPPAGELPPTPPAEPPPKKEDTTKPEPPEPKEPPPKAWFRDT